MDDSAKLLYYPKKRRNSFRKRTRKTGVATNDSIIREATSPLDEKIIFIRRTYFHLAGEIAAFIGLQAIFFGSGIGQNIFTTVSGRSWPFPVIVLSLLLIIGGLIFFLIFAKVLVDSPISKIEQYIGLGIYVFVKAIIFAPLLYIIENKGGLGLILEAGIITIGLFLGLTAVAFLRRKDFSFLLPILLIGVFLLIGLLFAGFIFGFSVRSFFSFALIAMGGGWILYSTSEILHRYQTNQHIQASLLLFNGIAWLFWVILRSYNRGSRSIGSNNQSNQ